MDHLFLLNFCYGQACLSILENTVTNLKRHLHSALCEKRGSSQEKVVCPGRCCKQAIIKIKMSRLELISHLNKPKPIIRKQRNTSQLEHESSDDDESGEMNGDGREAERDVGELAADERDVGELDADERDVNERDVDESDSGELSDAYESSSSSSDYEEPIASELDADEDISSSSGSSDADEGSGEEANNSDAASEREEEYQDEEYTMAYSRYSNFTALATL